MLRTNRFYSFVIAAFVVISASLPLAVAQAQSGTPTPGSSTTGGSCTESASEGFGPFTYRGSLVPCGRKCDVSGTPTKENEPCTICHMLILISNIFQFLMALIMLVTILFITVAGVIYIVSAGKPGVKGMAKTVITKTLTGFGLFFLSWLIVMTVFKFIAVKSTIFGTTGMFGFTCDTTSAFPNSSGGTSPAASGQPVSATPGEPGNCAGFSTNVSNQCVLVSSTLNGMLSCMKANNAPGTITSISSQAVGGDFNAAYSCCGNESCTHSTTSCHYGCGMGDQGYSHAIDIGISGMDDNKICLIADAAANCGSGKIWGPRNMCGGKVTQYEGHNSHLHISTGSCNH